MITGFSGGTGMLSKFAVYFQHGSWGFIIIYLTLITFFAFFYTGIVFNSEETAKIFIEWCDYFGSSSWENTADYLDYILTRLTVAGAAYIGTVCVMPEILQCFCNSYCNGWNWDVDRCFCND